MGFRFPEEYRSRFHVGNSVPWPVLVPDPIPVREIRSQLMPSRYRDLSTILTTFVSDISSAGASVRADLAKRFMVSLLAKRFVILAGLSGSGKTNLALGFAQWLSENRDQWELVAVGANWTNSDKILGYADALDSNRYVRETPALDLLVRAANNPQKPFFLILDEMNLSHVERYFSDVLSAMESKETLSLHAETERDGVPGTLLLGDNVFVIGTVNMDDTTYSFSPKVLDRANVIEVSVTATEMEDYLADPQEVRLKDIARAGSANGTTFLDRLRRPLALDLVLQRRLKSETILLFQILDKVGFAFGFRTAFEMAQFISMWSSFSSGSPEQEFDIAFDVQIDQKILPKLHGSRRQLEPLLLALAAFCFKDHVWEDDRIANADELEAFALQATQMRAGAFEPERQNNQGHLEYRLEDAHFPLSYGKLVRMIRKVRQNGFTTFVEA